MDGHERRERQVSPDDGLPEWILNEHVPLVVPGGRELGCRVEDGDAASAERSRTARSIARARYVARRGHEDPSLVADDVRRAVRTRAAGEERSERRESASGARPHPLG